MGGLTCTESDINAFLFRERCQTAPKRKSPNAFAEHPSDIANSNVNPALRSFRSGHVHARGKDGKLYAFHVTRTGSREASSEAGDVHRAVMGSG